jgi:hypothetical protein
MIISYDKEEYNSIFDFVNSTTERQKKFKEIYGMDIDDWNFSITDQEVISELLDMEKDKYILNYVDDRHDGFFQIFKIDTQVANPSAVDPDFKITEEKVVEDKKFLSFGKKFMSKIKNLGRNPDKQVSNPPQAQKEEDEEEEEKEIIYNKDLRYIN